MCAWVSEYVHSDSPLAQVTQEKGNLGKTSNAPGSGEAKPSKEQVQAAITGRKEVLAKIEQEKAELAGFRTDALDSQLAVVPQQAGPGEKMCGACKQPKPRSTFTKNQAKKEGGRCKDCVAASS